MLKTYQFKTHCKGDSHSSKTANIILPGLVIKQRWTPLRLQAKWYSNSFNCIMLVETTHLTQVEYYHWGPRPPCPLLTTQNCHFPLTCCVALITVYALPCDNVIVEFICIPQLYFTKPWYTYISV